MKAFRILAVLAIGLTAGCAHSPGLSGMSGIPRMVRLATGVFMAGSAKAETDAAGYPDHYAAREQPARTVRIGRAFAIGRTEVTRGQFAAFVRATGWTPDGPCSVLTPGPDGKWVRDAAHDWRDPGFAQTDAHPVVCVDLADAQKYAAWLSAATGRRFRLPSNVEWEYAARAGTTAARWWERRVGASPCRYANLSDLTRAKTQAGGVADPAKFFLCGDGYVATAPVASFRPNPWGLHDMLGNVWEWTLDCLNGSQAGAPVDAAPRTTGDCGSHIDRGGSWGNSPRYVRAAAQHPDLVGERTSVLGFRLVEDLDR